MKPLTCDLCGSTDIIKQEGLFVCQVCGTKYSVEEARRMMMEGNPGEETLIAPGGGSAGSTSADIQEASQKAEEAPAEAAVAAVSSEQEQRIENIRKLARRAKDDSDSEMAAKYYDQLQIEVPDDWEAHFYSVYYAAHNVKIAQLGSAANRVSNCMESTLQLVRKNIPEEAGRKAVAEEIAGKITEFKAMLVSNAINHLSTDFDRQRQNVDDWIVPALSMEILAGDKIRDVLEDYETPNKLYKEAEAYADLLISKGVKTASLQQVKNLIWPRYQELSDRDRRKKEAEQKKRIEAYWAEHAEEHEALLAEQTQLEEQKKELNRKIDELRRKQAEVPAQADVSKKDAEIDELLRRMNSLGLFKGKEKKAIQEQIDAAQEEIKKLRDVLNAQRDEIEKEITPISAELTPVNQRLREIKTELTKDR